MGYRYRPEYMCYICSGRMSIRYDMCAECRVLHARINRVCSAVRRRYPAAMNHNSADIIERLWEKVQNYEG